MESIEGGNIDESVASPPTNTDEAAVIINDGSANNDSTTADIADVTTTADGDSVISDEVNSSELHQMAGAAEGKEETDDAAAANDNIDKESALTTNHADTTAFPTNNEQTAQENIETEQTAQENIEADSALNSNDVDLLGFADEGATNNFSTDNQAEMMSSFPENTTTVETASNDFDLLGFGAAETPQVGEIPVDDISAIDENVNHLSDVGPEDGEKNDATEQRPDSDAVAEEPVETEETNGSEPISNQSDTDEDNLLIMSIANDIEKDTTVDNITIPDVQETVETTTPNVPNESCAVDDLLSVEPNDVSATIVTPPAESADNEVNNEDDSTQLKSEEVVNNGVDEPNKKDETTPNSEIIDQTQIETVEETPSPDIPKESGAGEDYISAAPDEPNAAIVTLPESADNEIDAEDSTNLNSDEVISGGGGVSEDTDTQSNNKDVTTSSSESSHQIHAENVSPDVPDESGAVKDLLSAVPNGVSATIATLPESAENKNDAEDSAQSNREEVINNDVGVSEAIDTQPNGESIPSVLEHVATEEEMGLNSDSKVSDAIKEEDAQTNVQEMSLPADEPTATFAELPESTSINLNEESTHLNVVNNNVDLTSETPDTQTNEVHNANMLDDLYQEEEEEGGAYEVQNTKEEDGINLTPVQNNQEGNPTICAPAEAHTEEEAEWLAMGLTLGDALRQIVALTDERDSALVICQEKDDVATQAESLLVEVQVRLEAEMNRRAESDSKARKLVEQLNTYEERLQSYERMEDELEAAQANLVTSVSEKSKLELEIAKLREVRDESERKEAVLSNRLNEAKKKEANKSNTAGRLELDNEELRANLESTKAELESTLKAKAKLEGTMEKLKTKAVERVKQAETALKEERELNEQRKRKMKVFVETKAEELREAKESAGDMQKELQETRSSLTASREREESIQKDLESARIKYREVQRDMERMKRNAEALHNMGNNLEQELEKSANETEEHKKKRISAKHELMTMMRTLEVEKGVSEKLRESMKFTFAPKAQSQQQLLSECLRDLEQELDRLSIKLGKALLPQTQPDDSGPTSPSKSEGGMERSESNGSGKKARRGRAAKADMDTERLISNLEQETQSVSKGIMALVSSIERMRILLDEDNTFNCMAFFSNHLGLTIGAGEARHQRLGDETTGDDNEEAVSITSFEQR